MREFKEAEAWLAAAETLVASGGPSRESFTVASAQSIHAVLRANDALTLRFLKRQVKRHDEAPRLFGDLVKQNLSAPEYATLREIVTRAAAEKSRYDYHGEEASLVQANRWLRDARKFVSAAREILGVKG